MQKNWISAHWGRIALVAVVLVVAGFALRNTIFGQAVETMRVVRGDLAQTVVASGRIITPQRVSIGTVLTERVSAIPVVEGQRVRRGDLLLQLDDRDERAAVEQARAALAQAEAKLRQMRELALPSAEQGLAQAEASALNARQQHERMKSLRAKGFVAQSQEDDARRALDIAESQLRTARLQVQASQPSGSDFALARTGVDQAKASLLAAQARLEQTRILSPANGVLIARSVEPGNVAQPGKELMALAPEGETQIMVQIDERNLARLKLGQKALASADAFPDKRFAAELAYINPGVDPLRGSVEVKLRVPEPPAYLVQDMTVSVDIEIGRRTGALVIPALAVREAGTQQPWVLAVRDGHAVRLPVKLGMRGDTQIEAESGVEAGDELVPAINAVVKPGDRVRAAAGQAPR